MKRILFTVLLLLSLAIPAIAGPPAIIPSSINKDANCNQSQYYPIGKLCADTDDGKLYKGTGSAVQEIAPASGGTLTSKISVITDSATGNVTAAQMEGQTHVVTGAYTLSLPTAVVGYKAKFKATTAAVFSLDVVTGTDVIILNGTALTAGNKATSDGTIYNEVLVECRMAGKYDIQSQLGLMTDGGI